MLDVVHDMTAGLLAGLLSVFLILYAFQPNRPYPSWMLEPAEQPWIFIVIIVAIVYLVRWDYMIGLLAILCVLAVVLDLAVFTFATSNKSEALYTPSISLIPNLTKTESTEEAFDNQKVVPKVLPEDEQVSKRWTVNDKPAPYELMRNNTVGSTEISKQAGLSGIPLAYLDEKGHYPIFTH